MDDTVFDLPSADPLRPAPGAPGRPRLQRLDRDKVELRPMHLDGLLPADHRARLVWEFAEGLDLGPLHGRIRPIEGHAGRPAIDPAILLALWLYATLEGVGSARALDRLREEHDAYRWLCGGVGVNHHTLADFRVDHADVLDGLLVRPRPRPAAHGGPPAGHRSRGPWMRGVKAALASPTGAAGLPRGAHRGPGTGPRPAGTGQPTAQAERNDLIASLARSAIGPPSLRWATGAPDPTWSSHEEAIERCARLDQAPRCPTVSHQA